MNERKKRLRLASVALLALSTLFIPSMAVAGAARVSGSVTDVDGNPLAGVLVTVSSEDGTVSRSEQTNKRGKFTMTIKDPAGTYSVRVEKSGYDSYEGPIELTEGQALTADFNLLSAEQGEAQRAQLEAIESKNKASRLYNEGVELYNEGNSEGAIQKFEAALAENPELRIAVAGIGRIHLESKRFDQAIEWLVRYEEMDPGRLPVLMMLYDAYEAAGMTEKANATVDSLVAAHPGPEAATRVFNQGVAAVSAKNLEHARERFSLVLELAPELHPAHINLAHIHRAFEDWEAALSEVDLFLAHEPEHVRALALRYEVLRQLGRDSEASEALALLQSVSPEGAAEIFHEQGVRLFNASERDLAIESFRSALEIEPGHPHSHYMLGLCLAGQGDLAQAVALLEKFLELEPENPDAAAARAMLDSLR